MYTWYDNYTSIGRTVGHLQHRLLLNILIQYMFTIYCLAADDEVHQQTKAAVQQLMQQAMQQQQQQ